MLRLSPTGGSLCHGMMDRAPYQCIFCIVITITNPACFVKRLVAISSYKAIALPDHASILVAIHNLALFARFAVAIRMGYVYNEIVQNHREGGRIMDYRKAIALTGLSSVYYFISSYSYLSYSYFALKNRRET
jgi:hypothetical protein